MSSKLLLGACQRTEHRPHVCVHAYVLADALPRTVARPLARTTTETKAIIAWPASQSQSQGRAWHAGLLPLGS